jgi:D-arabinose 1-dehydrogenase-like Zn-dependent alcohol dehydrogenase
VVVEVGPQVRDFRPGDRVATLARRHICGRCRYCRTDHESSCLERENLGDRGLNGGYAELVAVEDDNVARIPDELPFEQAAIVACAVGTELNAIRDVAHVQPGDRVLVTGAGGGLGIHGVQVARVAGAEVFAATSSPAKVDAIRAAGAHHVLTTAADKPFAPEIMRLTQGHGVDVAIDNVGSKLFEDTRRSLGMGGRWIFVGQLTNDFVQLNPAQVFLRDLSIRSAKSTSRRQLVDALELVRRGAIRPVIAAELPLEGAAEAHRELERAAPTGRIVLRPQKR